jgi:hypothetical protein
MRVGHPGRTLSTSQAETVRRRSATLEGVIKSEMMEIETENSNQEMNYEEFGLTGIGVSVSKVDSKVKPKDRHSEAAARQVVKVHSKDGRPIKPSVSITPISGVSSGDVTDEVSPRRNSGSAAIEIIPLGGVVNNSLTITPVAPDANQKSKPRDLKRSFSEDDKRRLQKKDKRRRDDLKHRHPSISPSHRSDMKNMKDKDLLAGVSVLSKSTSKPDPKAKLAGVIERLAYQTGDAVGIEIKPASRAGTPETVKIDKIGTDSSVEITLDRVKSSKMGDPGKPGGEYIVKTNQSNNPGLKLTIKNPKTKQSSSYYKSSGGKSETLGTNKTLTSHKSSSSCGIEKKASSSSSKQNTSSTNSFSKSLSPKLSSSSGRSSPYSKEKDKRPHISSITKISDKKKDSSTYGHREEAVKKLLSGNSKFDKSFQIPKISKPDNPNQSHRKDNLSNPPKFSSVSPKYTSSSNGPKQSPNTSPKRTSPQISPKLTSPVKPSHSHSKINERFITDPFAIIPKRSDSDHKPPYKRPTEQDPPTLKLPPPPMARGYHETVRPPALSEMLPPSQSSGADVLTEMELKRQTASPTVSLHIVKSPASLPVPSPCSHHSLVDDALMDEALLMTK